MKDRVAKAFESWMTERTLTEAKELFPAATKVRHLNPELSDWRGEVVPVTRGRRKGQSLDWSSDVDPGWIVVRVRWEPLAADRQPDTGWYGAQAIAPL